MCLSPEGPHPKGEKVLWDEEDDAPGLVLPSIFLTLTTYDIFDWILDLCMKSTPNPLKTRGLIVEYIQRFTGHRHRVTRASLATFKARVAGLLPFGGEIRLGKHSLSKMVLLDYIRALLTNELAGFNPTTTYLPDCPVVKRIKTFAFWPFAFDNDGTFNPPDGFGAVAARLPLMTDEGIDSIRKFINF